jgi:signal transduction histidine kinase
MQLLKIGILLTFLYFSRELVKSVRKEREARKELEETYKKINQYIAQLKKINKNLEEKNEDLESLLSLSNVSSSGMEIDKNIQSMINIVPVKLKHLKILGAIMVRYDEKINKAYAYTITQSEPLQKAIKILPQKVLSDYYAPITPETPPSGIDNLTADSIIENKIKTGEVFADFVNPPIDRHTAWLMQKIMGAKSVASAPINVRGAKLGAIIFIFTKPLSEIKDRDLDLVRAFTQHLGVVLENLQFYQNLNKNIEELTRTKNNLKEMLSMKNEFLHITSHQLRTPLTAIRGMVSMWYEGDFDNLSEKEKKEMIRRICISAERLNNITNDMLDALELEGGFMKFQFKPVSLERVIRETIDTLKPNYDQKNLYINLNVKSKDLPKIELEPNYIRQVFLNLIDNACKYTKKGGVDIDIKKVQKHVDVTIRDTGIGVSKSDQEKMFQKFTRGRNAIKENASGSGLGLFIAKRIVDEHQGKIEFHSEGIGKGSTVKVSLPVRQEK